MALKDTLKASLSKLPKLPKLPALGSIPRPKLSLRELPKLGKGALMRIGLAVLVTIAIGLAALLWLSGKQETKEAFTDGRRLLVRLDNGVIQGKQTTIDKPVPVLPQAAVNLPAVNSTLVDNAPSVQPSANALPDAKPELSEKQGEAALPKVGADGTKPWKAYAKPYDRQGTLPMIAIVVTGLGESKVASDSALKLPETVSLSFSPYARNIKSWTKAARLSGHEIMADLPMEPTGFPASDPGPYALMAGKGKDENMRRLQWLMSRFDSYVGFMAPQDEVYSSDNEAFKSLLEALAQRGVLLVLAHEPTKDDTKALITSSNAAVISADVTIDEELSSGAIQSRLVALEQAAKNRGYAVGIAQPYPVTMQELGNWAAKLAEDGFVLVPLSFIAKLKFS